MDAQSNQVNLGRKPQDAVGSAVLHESPGSESGARVVRHGLFGAFDLARHLLKAMRPVQWVKNVFVLAPIVFGLRLFDASSLLLAGLAFMCFCLVSSAVYLLNDIGDRDADAEHPTKRFRPIASGALPVDVARAAMVALLLLSVAIGALIQWSLAAVLVGYFALNVLYTTRLKRVPYVDIACISGGFLLRVLAGGLAIVVPVSGWLLACTFLLASLLGLGKRRHELAAVVVKGKGPSTRPVLEHYRTHHIDVVSRVLQVVTVLSYLAYTLSPTTVAHFKTSALVYTVPFVFFGIWRFGHLVERHTDAQSPTDTMVRDFAFLVNIGVYSAVLTILIYLSV